MRDEVPLVEQPAAAGLHLREYRVVRNGGASCASLKELFRRTQPSVLPVGVIQTAAYRPSSTSWI
jgi:hypothetical protein